MSDPAYGAAWVAVAVMLRAYSRAPEKAGLRRAHELSVQILMFQI